MKGVFKKSGEKIGVRVTIVAFAILIFVPSIAWWFLGAVYGEDRSENRILAKQPVFDIRGGLINFQRNLTLSGMTMRHLGVVLEKLGIS